MTDSERAHLTFLIDEAALPVLAKARHRWDPVMARAVPPHVTLAYPEESNDEELLTNRAEGAASCFGPFTLNLGALTTGSGDGSGGVFGSISDPTDSWFELRDHLLQPPFQQIDVSTHVTIVHPRTSRYGPQAFAELGGVDMTSQLIVREFCLTSTSQQAGMRIRHRFVLEGGSRQLCAGLILVDGPRGLLGLRAAHRKWYPGVWDLPGGRVEAGESLRAAACREAREELGVVVLPDDLRHVETLVTGDAEVAVFAASTWLGSPRNLAPAEHDEIRWLDCAAVAGLATSHPRIGHLLAAACNHTHHA